MKVRLNIGSRSTSRAALARRAAVLVLSCLSLLSSAAWASGLQVSPILVEFDPAQQAQALRLTNTGAEPLRAQVRVQRWSQDGREDRLEQARDVVASPAIVEIAPGQQQLVRLVRLQPAPTAHEQSYRVLVDELPKDESGASASGLQFLLRYSIPIFVLPAQAPAPEPATAQASTDLATLAAALETDDAGATRLVVSNDGHRRIRISQLTAVAADGSRQAFSPGLLGYVLSGRTMAWPLPRALRAGETLEARFNDDPDEQALSLDGAGR